MKASELTYREHNRLIELLHEHALRVITRIDVAAYRRKRSRPSVGSVLKTLAEFKGLSARDRAIISLALETVPQVRQALAARAPAREAATAALESKLGRCRSVAALVAALEAEAAVPDAGAKGKACAGAAEMIRAGAGTIYSPEGPTAVFLQIDGMQTAGEDARGFIRGALTPVIGGAFGGAVAESVGDLIGQVAGQICSE